MSLYVLATTCSKIYFWFNMTISLESDSYNTLNKKLSNSQLNKLKSRIKIGTEVTSKLVVGDFNNETNFPH